jgi:hypothetical protein
MSKASASDPTDPLKLWNRLKVTTVTRIGYRRPRPRIRRILSSCGNDSKCRQLRGFGYRRPLLLESSPFNRIYITNFVLGANLRQSEAPRDQTSYGGLNLSQTPIHRGARRRSAGRRESVGQTPIGRGAQLIGGSGRPSALWRLQLKLDADP